MLGGLALVLCLLMLHLRHKSARRTAQLQAAAQRRQERRAAAATAEAELRGKTITIRTVVPGGCEIS